MSLTGKFVYIYIAEPVKRANVQQVILLQHGNESCGKISISSKVDRQNSQYTMYDMNFYNYKLKTIVFEGNNTENMKIFIESKIMQTYT